MEGITYFRLESPYPGDVTKNCALTGNEVDSNFYVLEGRDVKSVTVLNDRIVLTLYNGDTISSGDVFSNYAKDLSFSFDSEKGILYITMNGETIQLNGFSTGDTINYDGMMAIASNEEFVGDGTIKRPLGLSPASKTGQYKPVIKIIDKTNGENLPNCNRAYGDRYITKEEVSDYGLLYPFSGVQSIATDLADANNGWRIPTKDDWDHMLDAVEPNPEHRNHTSSTQNKWLGQYAGKLLKTTDKWLGSQSEDDTDDNENTTCIDYDTDCFNNNNDDCECTCCDQYLGDETDVDCGCSSGCGCGECSTCNGINAFGFSAVPSGKADCYQNSIFSDFGYRAYYWTGSYDQHSNMAWIKEFDYNRCTVYQKAEVGQSCLSLRLVKDYDGTNYRGAETILGQTYPTVLVPSTDGDYKIWTAVNIALNNCCYHGIEPNAGVDITRTPTYFVNEWNGCRWIKYALAEGDSIVVINDADGKDVEYRVVDGVLVNVSNMIYNDVIEYIGDDLQDLRDKIDQEIQRSEGKDNEHDAAIEGLHNEDEHLNGEIERLENELQVEIAERENADDELRKEVLVTGEFIVDEGNLVLSKNDADDIVIPFGHIFNFGTI